MMKYIDSILYQTETLNIALKNIGVPILPLNDDFLLNSEFNHEHYVEYKLRKERGIDINFIFMEECLQIDIDRVNEAFVWPNSQIETNQNNVIEFIEMILTTNIKVQYCGAHYTKIYFLGKGNLVIKTLKYVTGFYLKILCKTKEYKSFYSSASVY